jgi:DNA phosphorothioation-dependent restriction protein DptG
MTPDQITALINLGAAGAVIATVIYFLRYISKRDDKDKERDQQWQAFFKTLLESKDTPIVKVAEILQTFFSEWREHDTWERTKLEGMEKSLLATNEPKTKPRGKPAQ